MALENTSTGELVTAAWLNAIVDRVNAMLVSATGGIWTGTVQKVIQSFRGLHLRTHYNALAAPSQVTLQGLTEAVMSDGVRYQPTTLPRVADITVNGPGGLDTGTEQVSTWYEIFLIGKSSTNAETDLRLLLHKAKHHSTEAFFLPLSDASRALRRATGTATDLMAQGLMFGAAGPLLFVDIILQRNGAVVGTVWVTLRTSSGTDATSTILATSIKLDASIMSTGAPPIRFIFPTPVAVTTGTQYHVVLEGDYVRSDTVNVTWYGLAAGGYASGAAREYNGGAWANVSGVGDFWFRAGVMRNDTALTFPAGYTQSLKIGYVYNNSSGHFEPFRQMGTRVFYLSDHAVVVGSTSTAENLLDVSASAPPQTVRLWGAGQNGTNGGLVVMGPVPDGYNMHTSVFANSVSNLQPAGDNSMMTGLTSDIITETQAIYFRVNLGTGSLWITGYDWGG